MKIPVSRLDDALPLPERAHEGDAGVDLYARDSGVIEPGGRDLVPTGIAVAIPEGYVGLVAPRSGWALRNGITLANSPGVVDPGYRGELQAVLINHGDEPFEFSRGDRIAQLIVVAQETVDFVEVVELPTSDRGTSGFGSSGV